MIPAALMLADSTRVEEQVELARWSSGNALIAGVGLTIVLVLAVRWMYRHEARGSMGRGTRAVLIGLRCAALMLLGLIGLEPVLVKYVHRRVDAYTIVLIDESASMGVADRYRSPEAARQVAAVAGAFDEKAGISREALTAKLVTSDWLNELAKRNRVKVFAFGDRLRELAEIPQSATTQPADLKLDARGGMTNLSQAVRGAIESLGGAPVAGVVLVSDGGFNDGEPAEAVAQTLKARRIPISAVGTGDASEPVNVRVVEVSAPRMVFKADPFQVTAFLAGQGLAGRPVDVELLEKGAGGQDRRVEKRTVMPRGDGQFDPVVFEQRVSKPGDIQYAVRAVPLEDESIESDNVRDVFPAVRVLDDKMRVLLVGGAPSFDYRLLARLLIRDRSVDVSCWLQSADDKAVREGTTIIDHLPATSAELFKYDAILLLDPNPAPLPANWASMAASLVTDYGGGILYSAGRKYSSDFFRSPKTAPLMEILPVVRDPDAELALNDLGIYQRKNWPVIIPENSLSSPILRMADDPLSSRSLWNSFEGAYWHYPVRREKPAATVLLRHSNPKMVNAVGPHVLMATQYVGSGRSVFVGFDDSWRWRRLGEKYFNRFWIQTLRYLVEGKLAGSRNRVLLLTDRDRFQPGEAVVVTVRLLDEKFQPLLQPGAELSMTNAGKAARTITLEPIESRPGYYQGRFIADQPGTAQLAVSLPAKGGEPLKVTREIAIAPSDVELSNPVMRRATLVELAEQTGGKYYEIDAARQLPLGIEDRSQTMIVRERPKPLWDNAYVFAALVGLLTIEWIVRRAKNLL